MVLVWSRLALALAAALLLAAPPAQANADEICALPKFRCNDGKCIDGSRWCNRIVDCPTQEDEQNCECTENEFRCESDGFCLELRKKCDGVNNCPDYSDEKYCATSPNGTVPVSTRVIAEKTMIPFGGDLHLKCLVDGYPKPRVYWTKDGTTLSSSKWLQLTESRLTKSIMAPADSGKYGCYALNAYSAHSSAVEIKADCYTPFRTKTTRALTTVYNNRECNCFTDGTEPSVCDDVTGQCICKTGFGGARCDQCISGYYMMVRGREHFCSPCNCSAKGSSSTSCSADGKCNAINNSA